MCSAPDLDLHSHLEGNHWSWGELNFLDLTLPTVFDFDYLDPIESSPVPHGATLSAAASAFQQQPYASRASDYYSLGSSNQPPTASEQLKDKIAPAISDSQPSPLQTPRSSPRRRYTSERWEDARPTIEDLYINQGFSLVKTKKIMEEEHDFVASYISQNNRGLAFTNMSRTKQYKCKFKAWHYNKNKKQSSIEGVS